MGWELYVCRIGVGRGIFSCMVLGTLDDDVFGCVGLGMCQLFGR
jgi:hypothetical protein